MSKRLLNLLLPAATGVLLGRTLPQVMAWGSACAVAGGVVGLYLSYYFPAVPSGAGIVLCLAGLWGATRPVSTNR